MIIICDIREVYFKVDQENRKKNVFDYSAIVTKINGKTLSLYYEWMKGYVQNYSTK